MQHHRTKSGQVTTDGRKSERERARRAAETAGQREQIEQVQNARYGMACCMCSFSSQQTPKEKVVKLQQMRD